MLKKIHLLIGLLLYVLPKLYAQNEAKVDSLQKIIATTTIDSLLIQQHLLLATEYVYALPSKATIYANYALKLAQNNKYPNKEAESYRILGVIQWTKADLPQAMNYFFLALQKYEETKNQQGIANVLGNIGLIYSDQKEYKEAMEYYDKAMAMQKKLQNKDRMAVNYNNIGDVNFRKKNYQDAINNYELAMLFFRETKNIAGVLLNEINLAEVYFVTQQYKKSLEISLRTKQESQKLGDFRLVLRSMKVIAEAYLGLEELEKAEQEGKACVELLQKTKLFGFGKNLYLLMSDIYEHKKDYQKALYYKNKQDSIENINQTEQITSYRIAYENEKRAKEKEAWEKERKSQLYFISVLVCFGLLILIILVLTIYHLQKNKKINQVLEKKNREIQEQNAEISQQQEEIQAQAEQLKATNHVKDKLFSLVAHDLRNPINSLKGVFFLLENDALSLEEVQNLMINIKKEVLSIEEMMANLLLWAKSQLSNMQTNAIEFDLDVIIKENFSLLSQQAEAKQITLVENIEPDAIKIVADINQMRVIIRNLLTNAIKFTNIGGKVSLCAKKTPAYWQIEVTDTGIGMTTEEIAKLFVTQTHFTKQGTANEKGSGLGLLLCKEFVENNGGKIWVDSTINQGTSFIFTIPTNSKAINLHIKVV
jgi:signal transduction histidine kinase